MRFKGINPFKRKSAPQRIVESVEDALAKPMKQKAKLPTGQKVKLPSAPSGKAVRTGLLTLGGLLGLTAGSAGVSSLRHRAEPPAGSS